MGSATPREQQRCVPRHCDGEAYAVLEALREGAAGTTMEATREDSSHIVMQLKEQLAAQSAECDVAWLTVLELQLHFGCTSITMGRTGTVHKA